MVDVASLAAGRRRVGALDHLCAQIPAPGHYLLVRRGNSADARVDESSAGLPLPCLPSAVCRCLPLRPPQSVSRRDAADAGSGATSVARSVRGVTRVRVVEPLLLSTVRIRTYAGRRLLTNASAFFFAREARLFLVTSRHVLVDAPNQHFPDRIELELHTDAQDLGCSSQLSVPLYRDGQSLWRQGRDTAGEIDVALIEIERATLPRTALYHAFTPRHLQWAGDPVEVGSALLVVGFPLGFHDQLHHLPVVRHAVLASSFGLRFQGQGYFLTDARTHRGTSGAPVVMRAAQAGLGDLPWRLLGIHSARLDLGSRDEQQDEALGLNCTWYADILLTLSAT